MANHLFTKALSATEVAERLAAVAAATFVKEPVTLTVSTNIGQGGGLSIQNVPGRDLPAHDALRAFVETWRDKPYVLCTNAAANSHGNHEMQVSYASPDALIGHLTLKLHDPARLARALPPIEEHFKPTPLLESVRAKMSASDDAAMKLREQSVSELHTEIDRFVRALADLSKREAEHRQVVLEKLENEFRDRTTKLDEEHRERIASVDRREAERAEVFAKEKTEFDARVKEFETRSARFVRRKLLERIDSVIGAMKEFKVSDATQSKRSIVHGFTWALMAFSATIAGVVLYHVVSAQTIEWRLVPFLPAASVTLVTTFVYYLKWNDRWFREHAENEFAAKQYQADILRASWVAELVSEWQAEANSDLPAELVTAFTRNLFRETSGARESEHPLEAITGLMKRVTSVTVGKGSLSVRGDTEPSPRRPALRPPKSREPETAKHD